MILRLVFIFILISSTVFAKAEDVVVLDGESGMTETRSSAVAPVEIVTPVEATGDGKLVLSDKPQLDEKVLNVGEPVSAEIVPVNELKAEVVFTDKTSPALIDSMSKRSFYRESFSNSFVHVYSGRLNSNLQKTSSNLSKEIDIFGFGVANTISEKWQGIMAIELGQKKNEKNTSKNIIIYQLKVGAEYVHSLTASSSVQFLVHSAFTIGDFNLRSTSNEGQSFVTLNKYGEGTLVGIHPGVGLRFLVGNFFHLDGLAMRPVYLGSNRKNLGGFEYLARFALPW